MEGGEERFLKNGEFLPKSLSTRINERSQRGQSILNKVIELVKW